MKILVLPHNVASMPSISVEAFNRIKGVQARGLFIGRHKYHFEGPNSFFIEANSKTNIVSRILSLFKRTFWFIRSVLWADAVYYVWNSFLPCGIDLKILNWLHKPRLVEWMGSEIRIPEIAMKLNPYIQEAYDNGYEYAGLESKTNSLAIQEKFKRNGFEAIAISELNIYIDRTLFPSRYITFQRLDMKVFQPVYPSASNFRPLIIHSPTAPIAKGTNYILPVIEELKKEYSFDFILLQNMKREEVLERMQQCDVFIDQIIIGAHGLASTEAMAFGKPVMCYLMPAIFENGFPSECPIFNTNRDTLKEQLIRLISNPALRHELGIKSRQYAEKYHDADKIAKDVYEVFKEIQMKQHRT